MTQIAEYATFKSELSSFCGFSSENQIVLFAQCPKLLYGFCVQGYLTRDRLAMHAFDFRQADPRVACPLLNDG